MKLEIATCQFPASADIAKNEQHIVRQIRTARDRGADVAHFCEGALSGYASVDFDSFRGFDWALLREVSERVCRAAAQYEIAVVLGSSHRLSRGRKPHNSVYVIDREGQLVDRYDKRFCAGDKRGRTGDLAHFSPGDHPVIFELNGVRCGVLICHEYRYPELYRGYKEAGVDVVFHSYHAANVDPRRLQKMQAQVGAKNHVLNRGTTLPEITMPATMQAAAASSHVWISAANSSARESCWASFFVRADGVIIGRLRRNVSGVLITTVDTDEQLYDSTVAWRDRAIRGVLHSGELVNDPRSADRHSF